jgi:hypothetical protein
MKYLRKRFLENPAPDPPAGDAVAGPFPMVKLYHSPEVLASGDNPVKGNESFPKG